MRSTSTRRSAALALSAVLALGCSLGACKRRDPAAPMSMDERGDIPGAIAFVSERGDDKDVWLTTPTGEERQLTKDEGDEYPAAAIPGQDALLVIAARDLGDVHKEQLQLVRLSGERVGSLHAPRGRSRNPSVAPDGSWLVAESDAEGFSNLVRMTPAPEAEARSIQDAKAGSFEPSISPDGTQIAFVSSRDGDPELYLSDAQGQDVRRLTHFHLEDWAPQWSPDGRYIAFLSNREKRARVFLIRPDGSGTRAVSGMAATGDERDIAWHPEGGSLVFVGRMDDGKTRLWKVEIGDDAVGEPVALTDGSSRDDQPAWSPDGKYLVFVSEREGNTDLYLMRADGSGQTRLTEAPGADWLPRWLSR
ncbi:TolB family protein [Haliangium ochraceum]|uniref:Beta-propeller repeat-containing to-pal system protein TolB n=1 Tax=Haliangium ochraceum (strain DSM 14365 / JCM 11303 / SMP-2) TaxID=502025 RepID=D0LQ76_HALO1|nr:TolB family protein [Haliangium ochraceum]ACY18885.1 beta-propeller repeat-containing to-pal system protein TolB [Haliangium ochraceum DSM 14365]